MKVVPFAEQHHALAQATLVDQASEGGVGRVAAAAEQHETGARQAHGELCRRGDERGVVLLRMVARGKCYRDDRIVPPEFGAKLTPPLGVGTQCVRIETVRQHYPTPGMIAERSMKLLAGERVDDDRIGPAG